MRYESLWALRIFARPLMVVFVVSTIIMAATGVLEMRAMWETQKVFQPLFVELQQAQDEDEASAASGAEALGRKMGKEAVGELGARVGGDVGEELGDRFGGGEGARQGRRDGAQLGQREGEEAGANIGEEIATSVARRLQTEAVAEPQDTVAEPQSLLKSLAAKLGIDLDGEKAPDRPLTRKEVLERLYSGAISLFAFFLAASIATALSHYLSVWLSEKLMVSLRASVFGHLQTLSLSFFEGRQSGELISRVNNDTTVLKNMMGSSMAKLIVSPVTVLSCIGAMLAISVPLTLVTAVIIPIIIFASAVMGKRMRHYSRTVQEKLADLTAIVNETFQGVRVVRIFGLEALAGERFDHENVSVLRNELRSARMRGIHIILVGALTGLAICGALLMGAREVALGHTSTAQLMTFMLLMQTASSRLSHFAKTSLELQRAEAAAGRILQILAERPEITEAEDAVELHSVEARVTFDHVSFAYDDQPVINDLSLDIKPGEVVALVGPSGAGKTTLANLVARLYDVDSGSVSIDNIDVRQVKLASLARHMGIVPQETILFGASVAENIGYGKPGATREEIIEAARAANAHDFILGLPEGDETQVGERGAKLSGGQKQRVAIARALLRDPAILILDEATSSLDTESEAAIHRALQTLIKGRTTILIAHRLSTVQNADRIVVLEAGRVVEQGTHEDLLARGQVYYTLYQTGSLRAADSEPNDSATGEVS